MDAFAQQVSTFSAIGVIISQVFILCVCVLWVAEHSGGSYSKKAGETLNTIGVYSLGIAFLVALGGVITSLIYSNVIGFEPCELCWIQRIFLYPQVVILGLALWKKTRDASLYCLVLSSIGFIIAAYHYYGQMFNPGALPACEALGEASCAVLFFVQFGYITIPMMSLTAFGILIVCMLLAKRNEK